MEKEKRLVVLKGGIVVGHVSCRVMRFGLCEGAAFSFDCRVDGRWFVLPFRWWDHDKLDGKGRSTNFFQMEGEKVLLPAKVQLDSKVITKFVRPTKVRDLRDPCATTCI